MFTTNSSSVLYVFFSYFDRCSVSRIGVPFTMQLWMSALLLTNDYQVLKTFLLICGIDEVCPKKVYTQVKWSLSIHLKYCFLTNLLNYWS